MDRKQLSKQAQVFYQIQKTSLKTLKFIYIF